MHITEGAELLFEQLIAWRRHLHAHPELSFEEVNTAAYVVEQLKKLPNLHIESNVGGHGVVATLSTGDGPTIDFRDDMYSLPFAEENYYNFISKNNCIIHKRCHDVLTDIFLYNCYCLD